MAVRRLHLLLGAFVLGFGLLLISVEHTALGSTARANKEGGIFRISINAASGIDYLDPALASTPPAWSLLDTTCARLLAYPDKAIRKGFRLQPEVAESLPTVSAAGGRTPSSSAVASGSATGLRCAPMHSRARSTACLHRR